MLIFCHLLNDNSGSPIVLRSTIEALSATNQGQIFVGSHGAGVLDQINLPKRYYYYRRSRYKIITFLNYLVSQTSLYVALSRSKLIYDDTVVFVNTLLPFGAMLWARRNGVPLIVHIHEISITPKPLRTLLLTCARYCADQLIYVSHDHLLRLPIEGVKSEILYNPVSSIITERSVNHVRVNRDRFTVLMLASPRSYKGLAEFVNLANSLKLRDDICFHLVLNADTYEAKLFAKNQASLSNLTVFPRTDSPADFYEKADLVVNLSRVDQWIETFGLTLVEAMSFGLPVIGPPVGGPVEIITHGKDGFCIDSRDTEALSQAVLKLVDDPETYAAMSMTARARSKNFSFAAYASNLNLIMDDFRSTFHAQK